MTNIIKLKFLRYGHPAGRDYTIKNQETILPEELL